MSSRQCNQSTTPLNGSHHIMTVGKADAHTQAVERSSRTFKRTSSLTREIFAQRMPSSRLRVQSKRLCAKERHDSTFPKPSHGYHGLRVFPMSGDIKESFNRVDVFKRHLTTDHDVEWAPPASRKPISVSRWSTTKKLSSYDGIVKGYCSICSIPLSNAQDFYDGTLMPVSSSSSNEKLVMPRISIFRRVTRLAES